MTNIASPYGEEFQVKDDPIRSLKVLLLRACERCGLEPLDLTQGNPMGPTSLEYAKEIMRLADLESQGRSSSNAYTSSIGYPDFLRAMSELEKEVNGIDIPPENILAVPGAAEGIATLLFGFKEAGKSGDVILLSPYFPPYKGYIDSAGLTPKIIEFMEEDALLEKIGQEIDHHTRAIIINSPNNPSGHIYSEEFLKGLGNVLNKHGNILLISDEPYRRLILPGEKMTSVIATLNYPNTAVVYSFSKEGRVAGCRDGYVALHPDFPKAEETILALANTLPKRGVLQSNTREQIALSRCKLPLQVDWSGTMELMVQYVKALTEMGYQVIPPQGAFYICVKSPDGDGKQFQERLLNNGLGTVSGPPFGIPDCVRLALCTEDAGKTKEVFQRFEKVLDSY